MGIESEESDWGEERVFWRLTRRRMDMESESESESDAVAELALLAAFF